MLHLEEPRRRLRREHRLEALVVARLERVASGLEVERAQREPVGGRVGQRRRSCRRTP